MKELMQFIRATADLARHKIKRLETLPDGRVAGVVDRATEPTFEEIETFLEHLAEVPEGTDKRRVCEWARWEVGELAKWQLSLVVMWYGDQIVNAPGGGTFRLSFDDDGALHTHDWSRL